jgi:hypothetical protein
MTKRETAIVLAKVAGYHNDTTRFIRLIVESRVNRQVMNDAWITGQTLKDAGMPCCCIDCRQSTKD